MRKALKLVDRPEEQFIERYERLHAWALALTSGNEDQADDLVHDAFIQFTLRRTELGTIQNTDGYLNRMLRNMFLSQVRRSANLQQFPESIADYDSAELGLRIVDPQVEVQIADDLRRICQYASERKETYKGGSVLILRFFHGYYLDEIAQLLRSPMDSIYGFLKIARREARLYLEDPDSLKLVVASPSVESIDPNAARNPLKLLTEMRNLIFASRRGVCLEQARLDRSYARRAAEKLDCLELAHLVSCPTCLDEVNRMLDLPLLADRYPTDTLGQSDDRRPGGGDDGAPQGGGSRSAALLKRKHSRRFKDVFDHRPQELRVSVNGFVLGSQKVGQELNEQTISVNIDERIGFVEVFSEQGVRLLFCDVDQPVDGDVEQRSEVRFSDGRRLELAVDFRSTWPTLQVLYVDPVLKSASVPTTHEAPEVAALAAVDSSVESGAEFGQSDRIKSTPFGVDQFWRLIRNSVFWLRPATVTAFAALLLIVAVLLVNLRRGPVPIPTASALLAQAAKAEQEIAARTDQVIHRTVNLEERKPTGELVARHRMEVWQSAEKGISTRRLYDDKGYLVRGDWRRRDGVETVYSHGVPPRIQLAPGKERPSVTFDSAWQLDPSAQAFAELIPDSARAQVEEQPTSFAINYENSERGNGLVKATLVLSRADLHATQQTLVIRQGQEVREYRYLEVSFEHRSPVTVAPSVFEPEPELLSALRRPNSKSEAETLAADPKTLTPALATPELEVEALRLLSSAGADMGEQVSVTRTSEGKLRIGGIVDTSGRKAAIVDALSPVAKNPAVRIDIQTAAEAVTRSKKNEGSVPVDVQRVEIANDSIPAGADLRRYFHIEGTEDTEEVRRFASRVINLSSLAVSHAGAMRRLVNQFSPEELRALQPEAREKWLALIRSHALAFERETATLRRELQPIFSPSSAPGVAPSDLRLGSDAELVGAVQRLFDFAAANYEAVRSAFSASNGSSGALSVKSPQFWKSLAESEAAATKIEGAAQR